MESLYKIGDNVLIKEKYALLVKLNIGIKCKTVDFLMMAICIL